MIEAYILMKVEPGTSPRVLEELGDRPEIDDVKEAYGEFDIIAHVKVKEKKQLKKIVYGIRKSAKEVKKTTTMIVTERG